MTPAAPQTQQHSMERFNARFMAGIVFIIVATLSLGLSLAITAFFGFYWDFLSIFGSSPRAGTFLDTLFHLAAGALALASLYLAYRLAGKTYRKILSQQLALASEDTGDDADETDTPPTAPDAQPRPRAPSASRD